MTDCACPPPTEPSGFFARLARDRAGNTLAMIAAAIAPIMAMVGGGVDMGRSYLAQARLQQACDAGVLAARKRLGSEAAFTGTIPESTGEIGQRFFNINFRDGAYGSTDRRFNKTLEEDYSIAGSA
ncbi:MAG TPA: pilus assembly protein TadG-related protein, partial [Vicinamibacterales bacterium]|nr:pilus assembly protein TadG-related protein [Vicinamibacterales bacterium]